MKTERFSPIALAVLALLYEAPMHPYRMQQLLKQRGKDEVINVRQRASLYQTIDRLVRAKLIVVRETEREEKWPERTIYQITSLGRATMLDWMRSVLATPGQEFPAFPAVLAHLALLSPAEAEAQLTSRAQALTAELARVDAQLRNAATLIPRLFLLETEFSRAATAMELEWVQSLITDLQTGRLTWDEPWLRMVVERLEGGARPSEGE